MFNKSKGFDAISSSSDEDEAKSLKEVYTETTPLVNKTSPRPSTQQITAEGRDTRRDTKRATQYFAAIVVTIGGFIVGTTVGWTSPAGPLLENGSYGFHVTDENVSWIAALLPLGAIFGCPAMAGLVDKLGRKNLMIILTVPTFIGWSLIVWAQSVVWIYIGRIVTGFASGSYSVIVPLYTSEIADKEIRGTLGNYFQLQVNVGILFVYILGCYLDVYGLTIACATIPLIFLCFLVLIPESPLFYLMKGDVDNAQLSLRFFRGRLCNVEPELNTMKKSLAKTERERVPIVKAFQTRPAKRGLFVGLGSMFFQQFCGCNAIIFYATAIFSATGSSIQSSTSTVTIGVMAVISTYISTLIVDKLGRKILLLFSIILMGVCTFLIGGFFYFKDSNYNVSSIALIPLMSLCIFIIAFSIGFGPIPWMMIGEIFPAQIKGISSSIVCMSNWFFAFLVTKFFITLVSAIFIYNTFFLFSFFSLLGIFFVILIVPETKSKTMEEIQVLLSADPVLPENIENQNETQG